MKSIFAQRGMKSIFNSNNQIKPKKGWIPDITLIDHPSLDDTILIFENGVPQGVGIVLETSKGMITFYSKKRIKPETIALIDSEWELRFVDDRNFLQEVRDILEADKT